jgi:hypothetical protein
MAGTACQGYGGERRQEPAPAALAKVFASWLVKVFEGSREFRTREVIATLGLERAQKQQGHEKS